MTQGYGPQDPNQPPQGQPQYPPPPPSYGPPTPGAYGQPGFAAERPGTYMGRQLANWPQRVGAYLIDYLIFAIPVGIAVLLLNGNADPSGTAVLLSALLYLVSFGVWIYNRWVQQGRTGQTWGKQALGLRLVRMDNGQPIGGLMAFGRDIVHIVDSLPCGFLGLGWLWPIWDARRQTFADKILNTVVIAD